jgi:PilZ domain
MNQETSTGKFAGGADRRRIARYSCRGLAQIKCLPLDGATLTGRLRDVGLGGCCIENVETTSGFELGTRTEIVIEVDSWIFRAMALVRALRDRSGISLEFVRMSHGGFSRLAEFIADLERPRLAQYARRPPQPTVWNLPTAGLERTNLANLPADTAVSSKGVAIVGTVMPPQPTDEDVAAIRRRWLRRSHPGTTSVDIFI